MQPAEEIGDAIHERLNRIEKILDTVPESTLNTQPLPNKMSPAEVINHILMADRAPLWFWKLLHGFLNWRHDSYKVLEDRPIRRGVEWWKLDKGKPRTAKYITVEKLRGRLEKAKAKAFKRAEHMSDKERYPIKATERHTWGHLSQVELMLDMIASETQEHTPETTSTPQ